MLLSRVSLFAQAKIALSVNCLSNLPRYASTSVVQKEFRKPGNKDIVLIEGVRTPFLPSGTHYKDLISFDLARDVLCGLSNRLKLDKSLVDYIVLGTVIQEIRTTNVAREASLSAGFPESVPAHTVTMACISSNQAITTCIGAIISGNAEVAIAGGVEFMSDIPIRHSRKMRELLLDLTKAKTLGKRLSLATRLFDGSIWVPELPSIAEFSSNESMGHSGDRLAAAFGVSRRDQDEFAIRSHTLAKEAFDNGFLTDLIPVKISSRPSVVDRDEGIRPSGIAAVSKLKPSFVKPHGTATAANSSFLTDGASACLLTTLDKAKALGWKPKCFLRDYIYVSQDPKDQLLLSPAYAIPRLLSRNGLNISDIDVYEIHEAFAGVVLANLTAMNSEYFCTKKLGMNGPVGQIPIERINVWGGSLSLGHPFGATGVRLVTMATNRLKHEKKRLALVAACASGGLGHAMLLEAI